MKRRSIWLRWMVLVSCSAIVPGFVMRCDKAALNYQRAFWSGAGALTAQLVLDQIPDDTEQGQ